MVVVGFRKLYKGVVGCCCFGGVYGVRCFGDRIIVRIYDGGRMNGLLFVSFGESCVDC